MNIAPTRNKVGVPGRAPASPGRGAEASPRRAPAEGENPTEPPQEGQPPGEPPGGQPPTSVDQDMVRFSTELAALGKDLRPGDKIVVRLGNDQVVEISKDGPDRWTTFKNVVSDIGTSTVRALNGAIQEDPSFTLREAIEVAKRRIQQTNLEGLKDVTLNGLVPAVRTLALGLDIVQARRTFTHPEAGFIDKAIDGGHVFTDVLGVIGAFSGLIPALQAIPGVQHFVTTAVTADIVAFGYHLLRWFKKTGNRPFSRGEEEGGEGDAASRKHRTDRQQELSVRVKGVPRSIAVPATAATLASVAAS